MLKAAGIIGAFNVGGFALTAWIKSEVITDLLGTGSIGLSAVALGFGGDARVQLAAAAIGLWSARLSSFLAYRAFLNGDERLQKFLPPADPKTGEKEPWGKHPKRLKALATFWGVQSVWGFVMLLPLMLQHHHVPRFAGSVGLALSAFGFLLEAVADYQKFSFKSSGGNNLMTSGLYSIVQYPNYTGEILFWLGMGVYMSSSLPWSRVPVAFLPVAFCVMLLTKVSGIPLSERSRAKRFADDEKYQEYNKKTSKLVPGIY